MQLECNVSFLEALGVIEQIRYSGSVKRNSDVISNCRDEEVGPGSWGDQFRDHFWIRFSDPGPHGGFVKSSDLLGIVDFCLEAPDTHMGVRLVDPEIKTAISAAYLESCPDPEILEALVGHEKPMTRFAAW